MAYPPLVRTITLLSLCSTPSLVESVYSAGDSWCVIRLDIWLSGAPACFKVNPHVWASVARLPSTQTLLTSLWYCRRMTTVPSPLGLPFLPRFLYANVIVIVIVIAGEFVTVHVRGTSRVRSVRQSLQEPRHHAISHRERLRDFLEGALAARRDPCRTRRQPVVYVCYFV